MGADWEWRLAGGTFLVSGFRYSLIDEVGRSRALVSLRALGHLRRVDIAEDAYRCRRRRLTNYDVFAPEAKDPVASIAIGQHGIIRLRGEDAFTYQVGWSRRSDPASVAVSNADGEVAVGTFDDARCRTTRRFAHGRVVLPRARGEPGSDLILVTCLALYALCVDLSPKG
jgi:hypothetical protein